MCVRERERKVVNAMRIFRIVKRRRRRRISVSARRMQKLCKMFENLIEIGSTSFLFIFGN